MGLIVLYSENNKSFYATYPFAGEEEYIVKHNLFITSSTMNLYVLEEIRINVNFRRIKKNEDELTYLNEVVSPAFYDLYQRLRTKTLDFSGFGLVIHLNGKNFKALMESLIFVEYESLFYEGREKDEFRAYNYIRKDQLSLKEAIGNFYLQRAKYSRSYYNDLNLKVLCINEVIKSNKKY